MSFVNEYISKEDIEKYGIEKAYIRYHPFLIEDGVPSYHKFDWTVDRASDTYLVQMKTGREEWANRVTWIFGYKDKEFTIELDKKKGSLSFNESPYLIVWDLVDIKPSDLSESEREIVISLLKDALTVYGYFGVRRQIENTQVKFNF
ncbi:MAG: hypothetical protein ACRBCS_10105 [Cellvibrionaceae bacterium]